MTRLLLILNRPVTRAALDLWFSIGIGLVCFALLILKVAM